jgi:hypothetical protein
MIAARGIWRKRKARCRSEGRRKESYMVKKTL